MWRWKIVGLTSLTLFLISFSYLCAQSLERREFFHPADIEVFSISLTFDIGTPFSEIFRKASLEFVNVAINLLPLNEYIKVNEKDIRPDDFLSRLSIQRRSPTKEGKIEFQLSAYIDMRKLLFYLSSQQTSISVDIKECAELTPFLKKALFEFSVSATVVCNLKREGGREFHPNVETVKIDGAIFSNQKRIPLSLKKELMFFSVPPYHDIYEELRNILLKDFTPKYKKKDFIVSAKKDKFGSFLSSVSKIAYFIAVVPIYYKEKSGGDVESRIEFLYFPVVEDKAVEDLIVREIEKVQGSIIK